MMSFTLGSQRTYQSKMEFDYFETLFIFIMSDGRTEEKNRYYAA